MGAHYYIYLYIIYLYLYITYPPVEVLRDPAYLRGCYLVHAVCALYAYRRENAAARRRRPIEPQRFGRSRAVKTDKAAADKRPLHIVPPGRQRPREQIAGGGARRPDPRPRARGSKTRHFSGGRGGARADSGRRRKRNGRRVRGGPGAHPKGGPRRTRQKLRAETPCSSETPCGNSVLGGNSVRSFWHGGNSVRRRRSACRPGCACIYNG